MLKILTIIEKLSLYFVQSDVLRVIQGITQRISTPDRRILFMGCVGNGASV
jgi:hypothetical protein